MGTLTISVAIFHSYVQLPEGTNPNVNAMLFPASFDTNTNAGAILVHDRPIPDFPGERYPAFSNKIHGCKPLISAYIPHMYSGFLELRNQSRFCDRISHGIPSEFIIKLSITFHTFFPRPPVFSILPYDTRQKQSL